MSLFDFLKRDRRGDGPASENDLIVDSDSEAIIVDADLECRMCGGVLSSGQVDLCSPCSARLSRHGRRHEAINSHW